MTFDLVVATVDRVDTLDRLLTSLERQAHRDFRVLIVDQNDDDRLTDAIVAHGALQIVHLRSGRGLSRARNAALPSLTADAVAFPDDDCIYEPDLLARVAARFGADPELDGLTGREPTWTTGPAMLTRDNLWKRAISFTIFLRRRVVDDVGTFDESLGLPAASGEEIDYLVRALDSGARIEYDPSLVVDHDRKLNADEFGVREGKSLGYILRKHRYPKRTVMRLLIRPVGGTVVALAHRDGRQARFHLDTLRGRLRGYLS
ncbi:MAG: glycosyltransferase family 2 protein [Gaiellaceae bacterium]